MKIVKVKGQQNRFLHEDVKMLLIRDSLDVLKITLPEGVKFAMLRRLPKTLTSKRVFFRKVNNTKQLIPFPSSFCSPLSFLPKEFAGDVLLRADRTVENVVVKFALEGDRVHPINEWLSLAKERHDRIEELFMTGEFLQGWAEDDEWSKYCHVSTFSP